MPSINLILKNIQSGQILYKSGHTGVQVTCVCVRYKAIECENS